MAEQLKILIKPVKLICGWCGKEFTTTKGTNKYNMYPVRICSHCFRTVNASNKEPTGNLAGRKHFHSDSKTGDVV